MSGSAKPSKDPANKGSGSGRSRGGSTAQGRGASNLKMPDLDFGGFGDDDEDDEQTAGLPADIFGAGPAASSPAVESPVASKPPLVPHQPHQEPEPAPQRLAEQQLEAPADAASTEIHTGDVLANTPPASPAEAHDNSEPPQTSTAPVLDAGGPTAQSPTSERSPSHAAPEADSPVETSSTSAALARREPTHVVASWGPSTGLPARRPRRNTSKPFTADQRQENREQSMRELFEKAPRYASLLSTYAVVKKTGSKARNVQLYGLTFERTATQIAIDTAVMARITPRMPTPRLIAGHYVDTAIQEALSELNPAEANVERIEDEKDVVFRMADRAIAYRNYIADDEYASQLDHSRTICPLSESGNALLTRLMTLLRTMPALKVQPFEIVSVAVSDLLDSMAKEQEAFEGFLARSVESSIQ
ncbi:hypothetical protein OG800_50340 (plasmid) [Streptomyces sp. NBC_00445]|uniref:hypothetical protein n=1 Tax=Streptomyces sp. NBC_00445 TaxID=2975745 RepID=UPI002E1F6ED7